MNISSSSRTSTTRGLDGRNPADEEDAGAVEDSISTGCDGAFALGLGLGRGRGRAVSAISK